MIPYEVQSATNDDLDRTKSLDLSDFINRKMGSVNINEAQNNPLQPDVQYRGFTASPLLGLPQGIAVYQDGVRVVITSYSIHYTKLYEIQALFHPPRTAS